MADLRERRRLVVNGLVQGVGFRPFVYSLARRLGLAGSVANTSAGVVIEVEGGRDAVLEFGRRLAAEAPALARVDNVGEQCITPLGGTAFDIMESEPGVGRTLISPDIATCHDCLAELSDPADRRFRHPFISCTNCGPRFTIITGMPYDRPATTMHGLPLCSVCAAEYADPADRRFHAQTVACPDCGPTLVLHRPGDPDQVGEAALIAARELISRGGILALKGIGGYHLVCDAADEMAVATLRKRKDRGDKPFAIMVGDLVTARRLAQISDDEAQLLGDQRRPVVLLARLDQAYGPAVAEAVAPGASELGVMLPYTPVHHLLFGLPGDRRGPSALVMTSGNMAGMPIVIDDSEAIVQLDGLADAWLAHDRAIQVPCDDSVLRMVGRDQLPVRRSRGYAPLPIALPVDVRPALAVGGDLKNTFCVGAGRYAWMSAHIGDMNDLATLRAFDVAQHHLGQITGVRSEVMATDRHPGYRSAQWAEHHRGERALVKVQHHHAHIASALADNAHPVDQPVIGFAFDGTGYGDDGAVWGGEVLVADYRGYQRVGHLAYRPLPGGDAGVRNPCRMALSHLLGAGVDWQRQLPPVAACTPTERSVLARQLATGLNCVPTSSMGRLFDAMSSLAGVCHRVAYEAEAAMRFEGLARPAVDRETQPYVFGVDADPKITGTMIIADPAPVVRAAAADVLAGVSPMIIAARFHLAVADLVLALALQVRQYTMINTVALSGGVFLNVLLTRLCAERLRGHSFRVLQHHQVPPSDAGLALGQLVVAAMIEERRAPCA